MFSIVMPLSIRVRSQSSFLFGGGGGGGESGNAEQHYVLFKELEPHLGLSLTLSRT